MRETSARQYMINLLQKRRYTVYKLRQKALQKYRNEAEEIEQTIAEMVEKNVLNDELYARDFVNHRLKTTNNGPMMIKKKMMALGLLERDISVAMDEHCTENIQIERVAKLLQKEKYDSDEKLQVNKVMQKMMRRGYSFSVVEAGLYKAGQNE